MRGHARGGELGLGDLHGLHAGAEAHGGVGLRDAAGDAAADAGGEVAGAEGAGVVFGFRGDEEEDRAFGGGFDPGPGDEALVDWKGEMLVFLMCVCGVCGGNLGEAGDVDGGLTAKYAASAPDAAQGAGEAITAVGGHGGLGDLQWLAESCHLIISSVVCSHLPSICPIPDSRNRVNWHVDTRVYGIWCISPRKDSGLLRGAGC